MAEFPRPSPALQTTQIFHFLFFKVPASTEIQSRFGVAVIERGEFSGFRSQIDEGDVRLVPILKRQFAFDAAVMCRSDDAYGIALVTPGELLANVDLGDSRKVLRL